MDLVLECQESFLFLIYFFPFKATGCCSKMFFFFFFKLERFVGSLFTNEEPKKGWLMMFILALLRSQNRLKTIWKWKCMFHCVHKIQ